MSFRFRLGYPGFFVLVALAIGALLVFLLGAAHSDLNRQAETDARNVVSVLEARLESTLRRAQAGLEELAIDTPPPSWRRMSPRPGVSCCSAIWPSRPGIFPKSPDFA